MLLHVSVVMWLGDTIEFFVFLSSLYAWADGKITEKKSKFDLLHQFYVDYRVKPVISDIRSLGS